MTKNRPTQESVVADDSESPQSGPSGLKPDDKSEKPTVPPPRARRASGERSERPVGPGVRRSGVRATPAVLAATVDVVVADMSKDPRREREG
jgi:hypothetical protein